jgi:hypothetical protein
MSAHDALQTPQPIGLIGRLDPRWLLREKDEPRKYKSPGSRRSFGGSSVGRLDHVIGVCLALVQLIEEGQVFPGHRAQRQIVPNRLQFCGFNIAIDARNNK